MRHLLIIIIVLSAGINLYAQNDNFKKAILDDDREAIIRYGEQLLANEIQTVDILKRLSTAYREKNNLTKSIQYLKQAYLLDSNDVKISLLLGETYLAKGEEDMALLSLIRVVELDENNTQALSLLLKIHLTNGFKQSALNYAKRLCDIDSTNASYYRNLGRIYESNHNFGQALWSYTKAVQLDSSNIGTILLLTNSLITNNEYKSSIAEARKGLSMLPDRNSRSGFLLRRNIANAFYRMGNLDSCLTYISNLKADGDTSDSYCFKLSGFANFQKGFFLNASEDLQKVYNMSIELDSLTFDIPYYLSKSYFEVNDSKNAIKYMNKAIDNLLPNNTKLFTAYIDYALIYSKMEKYDQAIDLYNKAKEYDNESPIPYYGISRIYSYQQKKFVEGIEELKSYIRMIDSKRKGKKLSDELEKNYAAIKSQLQKDNVYIFFETGSNGKKMVKTKVNSKGEVIEKSILPRQ